MVTISFKMLRPKKEEFFFSLPSCFRRTFCEFLSFTFLFQQKRLP